MRASTGAAVGLLDHLLEWKVKKSLSSSSSALRYISSFPSLSTLAGNAAEEAELSTVCYRPEGLGRLVEQTNFSRKELQVLYRGFKNVSARRRASLLLFSSLLFSPLHLPFVHLIFPCQQECPSGVVNEETFKGIYSQFFPQGGPSHHQPLKSVTTFQNFELQSTLSSEVL